MLLRGLTWLVFFQLLGTGLNVLVLPFLRYSAARAAEAPAKHS